MTQWKIRISKEDMKFSCAHFIAYKGFRERLHGHNYTMSICLIGHDKLGNDGYLIDFGDVKKVARALCKSLNEYVQCFFKVAILMLSKPCFDLICDYL